MSICAKFNGTSVLVIGQEKGENLESRIERNFGMMRPEGYRKCIRLEYTRNAYKLGLVLRLNSLIFWISC